jgi:hypothetical protein
MEGSGYISGYLKNYSSLAFSIVGSSYIFGFLKKIFELAPKEGLYRKFDEESSASYPSRRWRIIFLQRFHRNVLAGTHTKVST